MQHVALAAALFAGALFAPAGSSASASLMSTGASHFNNAINKPAVLTVSQPESTKNASFTEKKKATPIAQAAPVAEEAAVEAKTATVEPGDHLSKIADQNSTTYQRLYYANIEIINPDLIYPGQQLKVPAPEEELAPRPLPENAPAEVKAEVRSETTLSSSYSAPRVTPNAPSVADGSVWDRLAMCESGGNWSISTGNGFYGGLQFTPSSWAAVGGSGMPNQASREEQIMRGQMLQARQGWGAWPGCTAKLGIS